MRYGVVSNAIYVRASASLFTVMMTTMSTTSTKASSATYTAHSTRRCSQRRRTIQRHHAQRVGVVVHGASSIEDVPPEDLALVVELLDSETGEELKEKVNLIAENGLLTMGVVDAARLIVEANKAQGQDAEVVALLEDVYVTLKYKFEEKAGLVMKGALEFAQELMKHFTAEDLEEADQSVAVNKVQLMMREEFEREFGVSKVALAKYLDEVLPVMDQQDARIQSQLEEATTPEAQAQIVQTMMQRTKERMQIEFIRDCAARMADQN